MIRLDFGPGFVLSIQNCKNDFILIEKNITLKGTKPIKNTQKKFFWMIWQKIVKQHKTVHSSWVILYHKKLLIISDSIVKNCNI